MSLTWDWETRSEIDLKTRGAYVYAQHPSTDALLASFKLKSGDSAAHKAWAAHGGRFDVVLRWRRGEPCPPYVRAYVEAGGEIEAHNAAFERLIFWHVMAPRHGWPRPAMEQFRCSMASGRALGLPAKLEKLGDALNLKIKKDKRGDGLIKIHSAPKGFATDGRPIWHPLADDPASLESFHAYCDTDVLSEEEASERMIPLSDVEMAVYHMSERINDRGVRIDTASVRAAIELAEKAKLELDAQMRIATGGAIGATSQVARLTAWLAARGVTLDGVAKNDILEALDLDDLPADCREALLIRQEAAKTSTAKLKAFLKHVGADGRVRGMFIFYGTGPGRWASAGGVNLSNLPRPRAVYDAAELDAATLFKTFRTTEPAALREMYGPELGKPLHLVSDALRGFLWAAPGHEFVAVDYSGIQGAIGAWLSKEEWKLTAMREIIADPKLPDLYRRAAAGILNTTTEVIDKKHPMRQAVGKTSELSLAFGGGVSALVGMAANYGMRRAALHALYDPVWSAADDVAREKAVKRWEKATKSRDRRKTDILSREAWLACSLIVTGWRTRHPSHEDAWKVLEDGMRSAIRDPGVKQPVLGRMTYLYAQGFLWLRLPSGRAVAYAAPKLRDQVWARLRLEDGSMGESEIVDREEAERLERTGKAKIEGATSPKVTALGWDSTIQKMVRYPLYGGLAMQNSCLGTESDILRRGMKNCEAAGYPIVMHCYDEAVAETPRGVGSVEQMKKLLLDLEPWTEGLPLTAHGWIGKRYRK
jgi:DNA polymerase